MINEVIYEGESYYDEGEESEFSSARQDA